VSMGIYVMEPDVLPLIPDRGHFDFPDLVRALLDARLPVGAYHYDGLWFDIGRHEDYERAIDSWGENGNGNGNGRACTSPMNDRAGDGILIGHPREIGAATTLPGENRL
jgi:NDP-sugar pyrophosphorylase family protein